VYPHPQPDCQSEAAAGGDTFEPDNCPRQAHALTPDSSAGTGRTLFPAGDVDWFRLEAQSGRIYRVEAEGTLPLYLDVLQTDGTPVASDHLGQAAVQVRVKAATGGTLWVRLSALSASEVGSYSLSVRDLGADDHADSPTGARLLQVGGKVAGQLESEGDVDVLGFTLGAQSNYLFEASRTAASGADLVLELVDAEGTQVVKPDQHGAHPGRPGQAGGLLAVHRGAHAQAAPAHHLLRAGEPLGLQPGGAVPAGGRGQR
jgi:hypothetical protein